MQRPPDRARGTSAARAWADGGRAYGPAWAAVAGLSDYVLRLTPEQTHATADEVYAVLDRWSAAHAEPADGAEVVTVHTAVFPVRQP